MLDHSSTAGRSGADDTPGRLRISQVFGKLPAKDVERARAFYRNAFGLEPFGEHNRHLHYEIDGGYFIIYPSSGAPSGTHDQLGFVVEDVETTVAQLRFKGITFEDYEAPPHVTQTRRHHRLRSGQSSLAQRQRRQPDQHRPVHERHTL
jgi:catechol 2,3-dioxygenase-like lactoylglutathione lyase family enzyme